MPKFLPVLKSKSLFQWKEPKTCDCSICRSMCHNSPCWPSPQEAKKLIKLGYGSRMMLTSQSHPFDRPIRTIFVISPARQNCGGRTNDYGKACTFQKKGLCTLHNICKPIEGRLAICKGPEPDNLRDQVLLLWDNPSAQKLVEEWIEKFGKNKENLRVIVALKCLT